MGLKGSYGVSMKSASPSGGVRHVLQLIVGKGNITEDTYEAEEERVPR